ncbi:hypothetical protein [Helicobacter pylori]|uniref:hypothetical protein n=1 Tax=Helicobacter pylori TaxID=210 RepID=UPI000FDDAEA7|nr:hypothetical protein [Helicobacter pylori]RVY55167.1 hypothetical protein ECC31_02415 [Helicobacter pylori]
MKFPYNPKTPHNPIRVRYEKLSLVDTSFFILIVKNTQRHQFDCQYSIKNFYRLYKMRWNVFEVMFNSVNRYISKIFA